MIVQKEITLHPQNRGVHLVTAEIMSALPQLPSSGILNLLIKHTSAALALNENADPDVRHDLATVLTNSCLKTHPITSIRSKALMTCPPMPKA